MRIFRVASITSACIVLAVLVLAYKFLNSEGLSARKKPSNFEYAIANFALGLSIPAEAKRLKSPLTPDSQVLADARKHFKEHCAVCHAEDGDQGSNQEPAAQVVHISRNNKGRSTHRWLRR